MTPIVTPIEQFLADLYQLDVQLWLEGDRPPKLRCNAPEAVLTEELSAQLQARKPEIIAFLQQATRARQTAAPTILSTPRPPELPASFAQQRLWFLEQLQPETTLYTIPIAVKLTGHLEPAILEQAFNALIQRHETLRTNFQTRHDSLLQIIAPERSLSLEVIALPACSEAQQTEQIRHHALQLAQKPFNLAQDPLLRAQLLKLPHPPTPPSTHILLLTLHHIITDGWSMEILVRELAALYAAFAQGQSSPLPDLPMQYADFAVWQRQWLQGEVLAQQLDYWTQQLGGDLPVLQLPTDFPRARVQTFRGATHTFPLSPELSDRLRQLAHRTGTTLFMLLLAAFKVLLYRYTGQPEVIVGTPTANRNRPELEGLIGFFVNTLVLRTDLSGNPPFEQLLHRVRQITWDAYDHQDLPFEKLVEELHPDRDLSYNPLFQVKFRLEHAPTDSFTVPGLTLQSLQPFQASAKLDLSLDMYETANGLVGGFEYNCDLFAPETIQRLATHFQVLLEGIAAQPQQRLHQLPLLTVAEQQQILVDWDQTQIPYATERCFHHVFEAHTDRTPDAIALIYQDAQMTYGELNRRSNQLAHYLQQLGVTAETIVGICLDRSMAMIVALLAVWKAGGAYLPLDPAYPVERLNFMLENSQAQILITDTATIDTATNLIATTAKVIELDRDWGHISQQDDRNLNLPICPEQLAYVIYTSGSTGVPKGVLVPHAGLVNLTDDKIRKCAVNSNSCVLQFFSFSFDASIPEIILALGSGAKLCLAPRSALLPGPDLLHLLREQAITHITLTPSALSAVPNANLPALEMVLVGGEAPAPDLITRWAAGRRFINAYGPTETTVNASMVLCGNGQPLLPVLRPSANKQLYILDTHLQPVPIGVLGELHIGGIGLARGYLDRPQQTATQFIPNPFSDLPIQPTLYKTGDLACYLPDGSIKLLGRIDQQVKIRGFRIEPGEVEALLNQQPAVLTSAVIVREDEPGDRRLVAYIVPKSEQTDLPEEQILGLRRWLKAKLPDYLVPTQFVTIAALPLTPNGKIDAKALPKPQLNRRSDIATRTPTEATIAALFASVLAVESVGATDDFFELGGHSLLATRLIANVLQMFEVEISVVDLFEAPTVAEFAERIDALQTIQRLQKPETFSTADREEVEI